MSDIFTKIKNGDKLEIKVVIEKEKDIVKITLFSNIEKITGEEAFKMLVLGLQNACVMELGKNSSPEEMKKFIDKVLSSMPETEIRKVTLGEQDLSPKTSWEEAKKKLKFFS